MKMAFTTTPSPNLKPYHHPSLSATLTSSLQTSNVININPSTRRIATIAAVNTLLLAKFNTNVAYGFDFRMTVPDQTPEEAQSVIKEHAQDLMEVKEFLGLEFWRDAQKALRKSAGLLKQDIYTLIQAKPGSERAELRKMYSQLFNSVTRLDYAARSKDGAECKELFDNIVVSLDAILTKLQPP